MVSSKDTAALQDEKVGQAFIPRVEARTTSTPSIKTTQPDEILRHNISDEELEMLRDSRRDGLLEAIWGFAGIGAASLFPAINALLNHFESEDAIPLGLIDLLQVILLSCSVVLVATLFFIRLKRGSGAEGLVKKIRARKAS